MICKLHPYQEMAYQHILNNKESGLFLDMGMGKTISTLTALDELVYNEFATRAVLIIAPLRVAQSTWTAEIEKWDHTRHFRVSKILGTKKQRLNGLQAKADIYIINRENVVWLVETLKRDWFFDMVIIDELSSFKSTKAKRFKALRMVRPFIKRIVGLTGTPAPNSLLDLFPQMYLIDSGKTLGKTITGYRNRYFYPVKQNGHIVYEYGLKEGSEQAIYKAIEKTCISMKADDWLDMPDYIHNEIRVQMPKNLVKQYADFQREKVLEFEAGDVVGSNAGVMFGKLLQFANGAIYDEDKAVQHLHDLKLEALEEIVEEANGKNILVFYNYQHDRDRILEHFKKLKPVQLKNETHVKKWNAGDIRMLIMHPASGGHGLNLQSGGHIIVWFGLTCSLELYQQANARLYRQGQASESVIIHHIITAGTFDELVMMKLESKEINQNKLFEALKARL